MATPYTRQTVFIVVGKSPKWGRSGEGSSTLGPRNQQVRRTMEGKSWGWSCWSGATRNRKRSRPHTFEVLFFLYLIRFLRYTSHDHYTQTFIPLVQLEAAYDRKIKESLKLENVHVRWEVALNTKMMAYFRIPGANEGPELRIMHGDELVVRQQNSSDDNYTATGHVTKIPDSKSSFPSSKFLGATWCIIKFVFIY